MFGGLAGAANDGPGMSAAALAPSSNRLDTSEFLDAISVYASPGTNRPGRRMRI